MLFTAAEFPSCMNDVMAIRSRTLVQPHSLCLLLIHVDEAETPSRIRLLCAMDSNGHLMVLASIAVAEVRLRDP